MGVEPKPATLALTVGDAKVGSEPGAYELRYAWQGTDRVLEGLFEGRTLRIELRRCPWEFVRDEFQWISD